MMVILFDAVLTDLAVPSEGRFSEFTVFALPVAASFYHGYSFILVFVFFIRRPFLLFLGQDLALRSFVETSKFNFGPCSFIWLYYHSGVSEGGESIV